MAFKDLYFPINIVKNSFGGPCFSTNIVEVLSGREFVNKTWSFPKIKYTISGLVLSQFDVDQILAFFRIMNGRLHSFRFRDLTDCYAMNVELGVFDGVVNKFQLVKNYQIKDEVLNRKITVFDEKSLKVFILGKETKNFTILDDGLIQISENLTLGDVISASFTFDVKMRFDTDLISLSRQTQTSYSIKDFVLIEVI